MSLLLTGTAVTENLIFNSGVVTIGSSKLADITDITITTEFTTKPLYVLGSIKSRVIKRTEFKCGFKSKVTSFNTALLSYLYGSSTVDGAGIDLNVVDGQQASIASLAVTCYIGNDTTQPVQFQFSNAVIKSAPMTLKMNDFSDVDLEVEATDVVTYDGATSV